MERTAGKSDSDLSDRIAPGVLLPFGDSRLARQAPLFQGIRSRVYKWAKTASWYAHCSLARRARHLRR